MTFSQQELAGLVAAWPANRLIEGWNGIPGLTPVKKFKDRKSAVSRIWKAIQSLDGGGATEAAPVRTTNACGRPTRKPKGAVKSGKKVAPKPTSKAIKGKRAHTAAEPAVRGEARRPKF